jgi:hypothetical protein
MYSCSVTSYCDQLQVLWDHDTFGMKDFLGNVTFTLEDIRRLSSSDSTHSCQLQGVKTGVIEIKVKVISEETEVSSSLFKALII